MYGRGYDCSKKEGNKRSDGQENLWGRWERGHITWCQCSVCPMFSFAEECWQCNRVKSPTHDWWAQKCDENFHRSLFTKFATILTSDLLSFFQSSTSPSFKLVMFVRPTSSLMNQFRGQVLSRKLLTNLSYNRGSHYVYWSRCMTSVNRETHGLER